MTLAPLLHCMCHEGGRPEAVVTLYRPNIKT